MQTHPRGRAAGDPPVWMSSEHALWGTSASCSSIVSSPSVNIQVVGIPSLKPRNAIASRFAPYGVEADGLPFPKRLQPLGRLFSYGAAFKACQPVTRPPASYSASGLLPARTRRADPWKRIPAQEEEEAGKRTRDRASKMLKRGQNDGLLASSEVILRGRRSVPGG